WALMSLATVCAMPFALHDRPDPRIAAVMLAYFPLWASLEEGQWGPALLLWVVLSFYWLRKEQWLRSGAVASLALLKPNVGIALLARIIGYAICTNVPRRWWVGLVFGVLVFWVGTQALAPGWPLAWFEQLRAYDAEDQNRIDATSVVGAFAGVIVLVSAVLAWRRQKTAPLLAGIVTVALLMLPTRSFYNHVVLLLPIALLPLRIAIPVVLISWGVLIVPVVSADIVLARSLALYAPLAVGLAAAIRQTDAQPGDGQCAS
ncbi:glycosyltransferase 87 family protein, partial [Roseiflexus sp.]|uniref:glycosyltransferase 87 family protein n=1 Tax=Roseiflexus sp. TaxID=2562120 RepID=UPI00398B7AD5